MKGNNKNTKHHRKRLLLLATAKQPPNSAANSLTAIDDSTSCVIHGRRTGDILGCVATLVVFALSLGTVDALLGGHISDGLEETALADLTGGEVVDAVLESIDLFDARYFCLVEVV